MSALIDLLADSNNAKQIDGSQENEFFHASGPDLFDQLASELASLTVEISSASARRLYVAFQKGHQNSENDCNNLAPLHILEPLKTCNTKAASNELIVSRVSVDPKTGLCPRSGTKLRLVKLNYNQKKQLKNGLMHLAQATYNEYHGESTSGKANRAMRALQKFGQWLE